MSTKSELVGLELTPRDCGADLSKTQNDILSQIHGQKIRIKKVYKKGEKTVRSTISNKVGAATIWIEYVRIDPKGKDRTGFLSPHDLSVYFDLHIVESKRRKIEL